MFIVKHIFIGFVSWLWWGAKGKRAALLSRFAAFRALAGSPSQHTMA